MNKSKIRIDIYNTISNSKISINLIKKNYMKFFCKFSFKLMVS